MIRLVSIGALLILLFGMGCVLDNAPNEAILCFLGCVILQQWVIYMWLFIMWSKER